MQDVEVPVPSVNKNELLLKLEAAAINPVDWKIQQGHFGRPLLPRKFPCIPGKSSLFFTEALSTVSVLVSSLDDFVCR